MISAWVEGPSILVGLSEGINAAGPQICIGHLIRASLRWANHKDRKRVAALLRSIYNASIDAGVKDAFDTLADRDFVRENPAVIRRWQTAWEYVIPFFDLGLGVRKGYLHHEHDPEPQRPAAAQHPQRSYFPPKGPGGGHPPRL